MGHNGAYEKEAGRGSQVCPPVGGSRRINHKELRAGLTLQLLILNMNQSCSPFNTCGKFKKKQSIRE